MSLGKREWLRSIQRSRLSLLLFLAATTILSSGCARTRMVAKRELPWVIPVKCIYFVSPKTKCQALKGDAYVCREVLIKTACVEPKKERWR